ncbi:MAG: protein adenylyltransferase SelO [Candidatus Marinarcus sp.]|uniref:protein adenylyltransferase SelO n=1 Tax=Candidatus Marinarcus sp. TaxID=3100987 RepID=UPI003B00B5F7
MKLNELELNIDYFEFKEKFYQQLKATPLNHPHLISYNKQAFDLIGLDYEEAQKEEFVQFINGEIVLKGSVPYAMAYAGHQFGYFVPQLGDGRAINLGEINGWHLQTKGSGLTRYSRQGDGRAVLRSSIREYIMSEAMFGLGIATTRALGLIGSSHGVYRSYEEVETGAVVMRMSPSWIRIGTFEFFARSSDAKENLTQLADYVIEQSYPHLKNEKDKYEKMFFELCDKTALLMAQWQAYGFMHGVMNTDNMSVAGVTIDYGPFAFMDYFQADCICNHTDVEGRYSFSNQPYVARWNLEVLANSLGKICRFGNLTDYLNTFMFQYKKAFWDIMTQRLGLQVEHSPNSYSPLIKQLLGALEASKMDYNVFFYELTQLKSLDDISPILNLAVYRDILQEWFEEYKKAIEDEKRSDEERHEVMKRVNPKYIIKNYMLQEAIEHATQGDFTLVNDLLHIAQHPFDEHKSFEKYTKPTPLQFANLKLSCSS